MSVLTGVQHVIYPQDTSSQKNFDEPIQIRWPHVEGSAFQLCVGTDAGKWDILSADVGEGKQQLFDFSNLPASVRKVYAQLITIEDEYSLVGEIIQITR